jgi:hypothetical protein
MDEETFLVNRERAVDYLNSLEKVLGNVHVSDKNVVLHDLPCRTYLLLIFGDGSWA